MSLFFKECKAVFKSMPFFIYVFFLCVFFFMAYIADNVHHINNFAYYKKPVDAEDLSSWVSEFSVTSIGHPYGRYVWVPDMNNKPIPSGINKLLSEYLTNRYSNVYILGEKNTITLSAKRQEQIYNILLNLCGADMMEEIMSNPAFQESYSYGEGTFFPHLSEFIHNNIFDVSLDDFYRLMMKAGSIIGNNNDYLNPLIWGRQAKIATYEEALDEYNKEISDKLFTQDGLSGGLARVFANWISIVCLLLGGMVSIFYLLRDKKSEEVLASKSISSVKLFITKYISVNIVLLLPVLILAFIATVHASKIALDFSVARFDVFAFFRVSVLWVLPTNMFVTAFAMLVTVATNTPAVAIILAPLWFAQAPSSPNIGVYGLHMMIIRFNTEFSFDLYQLVRIEIIINRLFYVGISLIIVCFTVFLYHLKRGGRWNVQNLWRSLQKKY